MENGLQLGRMVHRLLVVAEETRISEDLSWVRVVRIENEVHRILGRVEENEIPDALETDSRLMD